MFRRYFILTGEIQPQQGVALTNLIIPKDEDVPLLELM